jgi:hypothetical protein
MTTELEKANRDLNNLEEQRETIASRAALLDKQRKSIAFAALTAGDKASKARLSEINAEDTSLAANITSVEAALTVARANLATAQRNEASAADRTAAKALQKAFQEEVAAILELGNEIDAAFADLVAASKELHTRIDNIHALGCSAPTGQQVKVNFDLAFKTAVQATPYWTQDFPFLAPSQRKSFGNVVNSWNIVWQANITARLGTKEAA